MVIGGFPAAKLGALLLRQASKPITNYIIEHAKKSPVLRTYICIPPAQFYNWCEVKTKMWILNLGKPVNVPVLSEAMAIELGASLLGEALLFVIAAGIVLREYAKSSRKEYLKELQRKEELDTLNGNVQELFFEVQQQQAQIRELLREIYALQGKKVPVEKKEEDPKKPPPGQVSHVISPNVVKSAQNNNRNPNIVMSTALSKGDYYLTNSYSEREEGVLTVALNYLYTDVYKVPLRMY